MNFGLVVEGFGYYTAKEFTQLALHHHCDYYMNRSTSPSDILYALRGYFCSDTRLILTSS